METPQSSLAARVGLKTGYAKGNSNINFLGSKFPYNGHDGITGTCFSSFKYNREKGVGFIIASNSNNDNSRIEYLFVSSLEQGRDDKKLLVQALNESELKPFLGSYEFNSPINDISGFLDILLNGHKVFFKNKKLFFQPFFGNPSEIVQISTLTFAWK